MKRLTRLLSGAAPMLLVGASFAGAAFAQVFPLGQVPGSDSLQQRVGTSVQVTCQGLAAISPTGAGFSADRKDLQDQCNALVGNGFAVAGMPMPGPNLGLDATQLNQALEQVSHHQGGAIGVNQNQVAFVQVANLQRRFLALREGQTGISIAGLQLRRDGERFGAPAGGLFQDSASGDEAGLPQGLGIFLTGSGDWGSFDGSSEQLGFDVASWGVTGGVDYRFTDELVAGLAFGYVGSRAGFEGPNGHLDQDAYIPSLYASYNHGGFYADAIFSYAYDAFDLVRRINYATIHRTASGDTHGNQYSGSLGGGYEFHLDQLAEGLSVGPRARFDYAYEQIRSFTESGANGLNLRYDGYDIESAVSVLGAEASYAVSTSFGVVTPQLRVDWNHEFAADPARVKARFAADPNEVVFFVRPARLNRDFCRLAAGVVGTFPHGISAFVDYETVLGLNGVENHVVHLGGRYEF